MYIFTFHLCKQFNPYISSYFSLWGLRIREFISLITVWMCQQFQQTRNFFCVLTGGGNPTVRWRILPRYGSSNKLDYWLIRWDNHSVIVPQAQIRLVDLPFSCVSLLLGSIFASSHICNSTWETYGWSANNEAHFCSPGPAGFPGGAPGGMPGFGEFLKDPELLNAMKVI